MSKYIFNNDTDILEFLEQLRENGIQIWGEGEKIRYRSKNRQLAPETLRILKMAKGQILDFFRMIEKNVIPLTSIQTAYVVGQTAGCELGNINAHYYIEYTIESLDVAQYISDCKNPSKNQMHSNAGNQTRNSEYQCGS